MRDYWLDCIRFDKCYWVFILIRKEASNVQIQGKNLKTKVVTEKGCNFSKK